MRITNIARASLHDGPGLRTVVYFAGCGLRCLWCHNPETIGTGNGLLYAPIHCVACGRCADACPAGCHEIANGLHGLSRAACRQCGRCAAVCPTQALSMAWREMDIDEVLQNTLTDRAYYDATGGGVTLSGGECLLQRDAAFALADALRQNGVRVAVETALYVPEETARALPSHADLVLADVKMIDSARHRELTGADNRRILRNLEWIAASNISYWVRTPVVPGANDDIESLIAIADWINGLKRPPERYELLPYNALGESKYESLGLDYALRGQKPPCDADMEEKKNAVRKRLRDDVAVR